MANLLIVGANRGIGYYFVERALALGHTVTVLDVEIHAIEDLKAKYPGQALAVAADARDLHSIENGVQKSMEKYGDIDIAVHNACVCTFESERDTEFDVYKDVMDVNYFGALRLIKAVLPPMRRAKKGRVILTSSGVGVTGFANISPYAASKGAIESLVKCLQIENAEYGISFHLFHPPLTDTKSAAGLPVPKEFMADAKKVGYGLADRMESKKFVICPSLGPALQMKFSYSSRPALVARRIFMRKCGFAYRAAAPLPTKSFDFVGAPAYTSLPVETFAAQKFRLPARSHHFRSVWVCTWVRKEKSRRSALLLPLAVPEKCFRLERGHFSTAAPRRGQPLRFAAICFVQITASPFGLPLLSAKSHARLACSVVNALATARCRYQLFAVLRLRRGSSRFATKSRKTF